MPIDDHRLLEAAAFAALKHRDQRRKCTNEAPYINHPILVANLLASVGRVTDRSLLIAALLHDTVEDTATSLDEIRSTFGDDVCDLVAEVTDDKSLAKQRRKQLQIEHAPHKSDRAKQLKIADKICNIGDIDADSPAAWDRARKLAYLDWAEQAIAGCRGVNARLDEKFDEGIAAARQRITAEGP